MANCGAVEEDMTETESEVMLMAATTTPATPKTKRVVVKEDDAHHPYAFHVSGPRNVASPNWRDLISSSWYDCSLLFITSETSFCSYIVFKDSF